MASAASHVFAVPELLELILLYVDERTLLRTRAVSKAFAAQIKSSIKIQRKLFFQAPTNTLAYPLNNGKEFLPQVLINPFLLDPHEVQIDNPLAPKDLAGESYVYFDIQPRLVSRYISKEASCRRMLLCQPPVKQINIELSYKYSEKIHKVVGGMPSPYKSGLVDLHKVIRNADGVRIGDLLGMIEKCGLVGGGSGREGSGVTQVFLEIGVDVDEEKADEVVRVAERMELVEVDVEDDGLLTVDVFVTIAQVDV